MENKQSLTNAHHLLQEAKKLLEQNQLTEELVQLLKESSKEFEVSGEWAFYLQAHIQWAIFCIKTSKFGEAEAMLSEALLKAIPHVLETSIEVGDVYNQLATCSYYRADYPIAQHYFGQALKVYQANHGENHVDTARTYSNLGNCCFPQNLLDTALSYYLKSLTIRQAILPVNHPHLAFSYSALGRCYHVQRNFKKALLYFQQALAIRVNQYGEDHLMVSYSHTDISACYINLKDYLKVRFHVEKALTIRHKKYPKGHRTVANCYSIIGDTYLKEEETAKALTQYQLAARMQEELLEKKHPHLADNYAQIGRCLVIENPKRSLEYTQKALKIYEQAYGKYHKKTAQALNYIGRFYQKHEDYPLALQYFQMAINSLCEITSTDLSEAVIYQIPSIEHHLSATMLLKPIESKARIFYEQYEESQNIKDIQAAFEHYQQLISVIDQARQLQSAETEQLFFVEEISGYHEVAIQTSLALYKHTGDVSILEEAFLFAEKGKALVLLTALQKNEAQTKSSIPSALLQQLKNLDAKLLELDKRLKMTTDEKTLKELQNQLFQTTQKYEALNGQLEKDYPEYGQSKQNIRTSGVRELQKVLKDTDSQDVLHPTSVLLSYYVGINHIYIFEVTANTYQVHSLDRPDDLEDKILDFQDAVNLMDVEDYIETTSDFYDLLLAPVLQKWGTPTVIPQRMIILRHDLLDYLPFEALLMPNSPNANVFAQLPYLIHVYEISYHYSATLLLNKMYQSRNNSTLETSFLGFAPVSFNGENKVELALESHHGRSKVLRSNRAGDAALDNLPSTEMEVKEVYQLFQDKSLDAKAFLYASASKENLIKEASKHKFLLISTHGFVEDEEAGLSGIYLAKVNNQAKNEELSSDKNPTAISSNQETPQHEKDYLLYTSDTYHLDLQADLVVLSSCSSGIGKIQKGEGMMAINRGFLYAGASNIIFTQFDIPDQSSSRLVKKLFEYILEGDGYSTALRKAKLFLLQEEANSVQDWAGYLLIGV